jgi:hypothetical protein
MYNIIYETTNLINGKKYIGVHKTSNINDGYIGSGTLLKLAIKKYGIENFERKILFKFDTYEEALQKEIELITNEIIKSKSYYNLNAGGGSFYYINNHDLNKNKSELNRVIVEENGIKFSISRDDDRYKNGILKPWNIGFVCGKDKNDNILHVTTDDFYKLKLVGILKGFATVKDKDNNYYSVSIDDERIKTGELVVLWNGLKHTDKTKKLISEKNKIAQKGEKNSQYGTCWIMNIELKENKKIKKEELDKWIQQGWIQGRKVF